MEQPTNQHKFPLFPESQSKFFWKVEDAQLEFLTAETGKSPTWLFTRMATTRGSREGNSSSRPTGFDRGPGHHEYPPRVIRRVLATGQKPTLISVRIRRYLTGVSARRGGHELECPKSSFSIGARFDELSP
jgi:hypothetical protein